MAKKTKTYTADDMITKIRGRFPAREYAVLEQVANATGYGCGSWIDAAVVSLWPSNGLWRAAMEVKVSRSDFLKEIQSPSKNAWARRYFHEFWFVAPPDVIKEAELPEGTGWLTCHGDRLKIVRAASRAASPAVDDDFIAALARPLAKEHHAQADRVRHQILAESDEFREATSFKTAILTFLASRGVEKSYFRDSSDIVTTLTNATLDADARKLSSHLVSFSSVVRDRMLDTLEMLIPLCANAILDREETGEFVNKLYHSGDSDTKSLEAMRAIAKSRKRDYSVRNAASRVALMDAVLDASGNKDLKNRSNECEFPKA